ncbi:holliday junction resolvase [Nocardia phage NBR1]|uniref:RuvC-like Holliday junction resolvase n=1 Tax=Nocardia phage NBR1 TaxID=1109711 RepID=UPI00023EEE04|nr:RuvC-like Holliday junction resolvase [Nocardia phage NBR1]AEV52278.1 holliday junction resolvase [Nocardia phage NBR1]
MSRQDEPYRAVVGLDASISNTGMAIHRYGEHALQNSAWNIKTKERGQDHFSRAERMYESATAINSKVAYNSLVLMEGPAYGASGASFHDLAGHWWKVFNNLVMGWADVIVVTPGQLKKFVTGKGNAPKDEVMLAAARRWPDLKITDNNTADATGLMMMGRALLGEELNMPKVNMEALKGLEVHPKARTVIVG